MNISAMHYMCDVSSHTFGDRYRIFDLYLKKNSIHDIQILHFSFATQHSTLWKGSQVNWNIMGYQEQGSGIPRTQWDTSQ